MNKCFSTYDLSDCLGIFLFLFSPEEGDNRDGTSVSTETETLGKGGREGGSWWAAREIGDDERFGMGSR